MWILLITFDPVCFSSTILLSTAGHINMKLNNVRSGRYSINTVVTASSTLYGGYGNSLRYNEKRLSIFSPKLSSIKDMSMAFCKAVIPFHK